MLKSPELYTANAQVIDCSSELPN